MSGFTISINNKVSEWAKALHNYNSWLSHSGADGIIAFLNDPTGLCTPGFVLRRHLQRLFVRPSKVQLSDRDAELINIFAKGHQADLSNGCNVLWDENFIGQLSKALANTNFHYCDIKNIKAGQWQSYLIDEALPNRETMIKLCFALRMDDATRSKLFLSTGRTPLNVRNPFEFICLFCLNNRLPYSDAVEMLNDFERQREMLDVETAFRPSLRNATVALKSETAKSFSNATIRIDLKKQELLKNMLSRSNEFSIKVKKKRSKKQEDERKSIKNNLEYASGFSLQNIAKLRLLLRYLTMLYPRSYPNAKGNYKPIKTDANGMPKVFDHLIDAMLEFQGIDLCHPGDFIEVTHEELKKVVKSKAKRALDRLPFNKDVLMLMQNLPQTLRSIMRPLDHPGNAQDLDRGVVLMLTYFLIRGWQCPIGNRREKFRAELDKKLDSAEEFFSAESKMQEAINNVINLLTQLEKKPAKGRDDADVRLNVYIDALNVILKCFELDILYLPLVMDRFVLMCLMADPRNAPMLDDGQLQHLISLVIDSNYESLREVLECALAEIRCRSAPSLSMTTG